MLSGPSVCSSLPPPPKPSSTFTCFPNLNSTWEKKLVCLCLGYLTDHEAFQFIPFFCVHNTISFSFVVEFSIIFENVTYFTAVSEHLDWFYNLTIVNIAVINMCVQASRHFTNNGSWILDPGKSSDEDLKKKKTPQILTNILQRSSSNMLKTGVGNQIGLGI